MVRVTKKNLYLRNLSIYFRFITPGTYKATLHPGGAKITLTFINDINPAPVVSNHGKLWGRARARGAGVERLKDHR